MSENELKEKFEKAIENLHRENRYLAVEATKLGYPILSKEVPTAGVMWDENKKKVSFLFNPNFLKFITDEEFKFTICHESMHLLYLHVLLIRDELEKMNKDGKSYTEIATFRRKMNKAMDCVVNDSLTNLYGVSKVFTDPKRMKIYYGKETVGVDCHDLTAMDVYYMIPDDNVDDVDNHDEWASFFDKEGNLKKDFVEKMKEFIEDNMQNSALSDKEIEKIDKMRECMKGSKDPNVSKASREIKNSKNPIDRLGKETVNWDKILRRLTGILKPEDVWNRPNRKLQSIYPDVILPTTKDQEKEKMFIAIDVSGSIDVEALRLFLSIIKNTPKRFQIEGITFDDECYKFDLKNNQYHIGGGGTNFGIIEDYIINNFKQYPKAVFVLTDGAGSPVNPKHPERWCWMLYGAAYTGYCEHMEYYNIRSLLI